MMVRRSLRLLLLVPTVMALLRRQPETVDCGDVRGEVTFSGLHSAVATTTTTVHVKWNAANVAARYHVFAAESLDLTSRTSGIYGATSDLSLTLDGLERNKTYEIVVVAEACGFHVKGSPVHFRTPLFDPILKDGVVKIDGIMNGSSLILHESPPPENNASFVVGTDPTGTPFVVRILSKNKDPVDIERADIHDQQLSKKKKGSEDPVVLDIERATVADIHEQLSISAIFGDDDGLTVETGTLEWSQSLAVNGYQFGVQFDLSSGVPDVAFTSQMALRSQTNISGTIPPMSVERLTQVRRRIDIPVLGVPMPTALDISLSLIVDIRGTVAGDFTLTTAATPEITVYADGSEPEFSWNPVFLPTLTTNATADEFHLSVIPAIAVDHVFCLDPTKDDLCTSSIVASDRLDMAFDLDVATDERSLLSQYDVWFRPSLDFAVSRDRSSIAETLDLGSLLVVTLPRVTLTATCESGGIRFVATEVRNRGFVDNSIVDNSIVRGWYVVDFDDTETDWTWTSSGVELEIRRGQSTLAQGRIFFRTETTVLATADLGDYFFEEQQDDVICKSPPTSAPTGYFGNGFFPGSFGRPNYKRSPDFGGFPLTLRLPPRTPALSTGGTNRLSDSIFTTYPTSNYGDGPFRSISAGIFGPHIRGFDEAMAVCTRGEFLLMENGGPNNLTIQGRFEPCGRASCLTAVVAQEAGSPKVEVRTDVVLVDGRHETISVVRYDEKRVLVTFNSGARLGIATVGGVLDLRLEVPLTYLNNVDGGLLGNPNGRDDDIVSRKDIEVTFPPPHDRLQEEYKICLSWCVRESMFADDATSCDDPYVYIPDSPSDFIVDFCCGEVACIVDYMATGDKNIAAASRSTSEGQLRSAALSDVYTSTKGSAWLDSSGWLAGDPCAWRGVQCELIGDCPTNVVVGLELPFNKLDGGIPHTLGILSHLRYLNLTANALDGELSDFLPLYLPDLDVVDLAANRLRGPIPLAWCLDPPTTLVLHGNFDLCLPEGCTGPVGGINVMCDDVREVLLA